MRKTSSSRKQTNKNIFTSPWKLNLQSSFCLCLHWAVVFLLSFFCREKGHLFLWGKKCYYFLSKQKWNKKKEKFVRSLKKLFLLFLKLNIFLFVQHFFSLLLLLFFFKGVVFVVDVVVVHFENLIRIVSDFSFISFQLELLITTLQG